VDLSYPIRLDDQMFWVRRNLWEALNRLQFDSEEIPIWIDAICINQENTKERNEQVNKMKTIYERADRVIVWLGPAEADSKLAFQLVQGLYNERNSVEKVEAMFKHDLPRDGKSGGIIKRTLEPYSANFPVPGEHDHMPRHLRALAKVFWRPYVRIFRFSFSVNGLTSGESDYSLMSSTVLRQSLLTLICPRSPILTLRIFSG
jgi:hypothetical protein